MGKIILIRHGQASFGENDYDQLSDLGEYQSQVTGQFLNQANIQPTVVYSGNLKRQKSTAHIAMKYANFVSNIIVDPLFNEYDYKGIINCHLPGLLADDPSISKDIEHAFSDYPTFERIFSALLERWISKKEGSTEIETFKSYTNRVIQGMTKIADNQSAEDIALVFTSGGFIAVAMNYILELPTISALKLGWTIYNCSLTSFFVSNTKYRLETFNTVTHLEMDNKDGIVSII